MIGVLATRNNLRVKNARQPVERLALYKGEKLCQSFAVRSYWKTIMATCFSCHKDISMKRKKVRLVYCSWTRF